MKANILHRDISANNLMVDPHDHSRGILIDLDLAMTVQGSDRRPVGKLQPPGTLTFRSIGLCTDDPREVYYRHDLESFFYVLVWIYTHYVNGVQVLDNQYRRWQEGHLKDIEAFKGGFIHRVADHVHFPHPRLDTSWTKGLANMFNDAYGAKHTVGTERMLTGKSLPFEEETMDGHITYDKFMAILEAPDVAYYEAAESE
jgi:hypothetical protein